MRLTNAARWVLGPSVLFVLAAAAPQGAARAGGVRDRRTKETWIGISPGDKGPDGKPTPKLTIDFRPMEDWRALVDALKRLADKPGGRDSPIVIDARPTIPHEWVVGLLHDLQRLGFTKPNFRPRDLQKFRLDAGPAPAKKPRQNPLPPHRHLSVMTVVKAGTEAEPRPRIVINGVLMTDWDHVRQSLDHLADPGGAVSRQVRVAIKCGRGVPFGWAHALLGECVRVGIWRVSFATLRSRTTHSPKVPPGAKPRLRLTP